MRIALAVVVAGPLLTTPAVAAPVHRCAVVTDAAGDVSVAGAPGTAAGGTDLRAVRMETTPAGLAVTIANTELDESRRAIWRLTFSSGKTPLYIAAGTGVWANIGNGDTLSGFRAGVSGQRSRAVSGRIDYATGAVHVSVPFSAFGGTVRRGALLSAFAVEAKETLVAVAPTGAPGTEVKFSDTGRSRLTFTVGRTC